MKKVEAIEKELDEIEDKKEKRSTGIHPKLKGNTHTSV